jgi:hypothetical protein
MIRRCLANHLVKRAVKNAKLISVALHPEVQKALEALPRPKAAGADCQLYFTSENSSLRSSVKEAQRTLWAVFKIARVPGAHPHRFRHTLASELLAKGPATRTSRASWPTAPPPCAATTPSGHPNTRRARTAHWPGPWHEFSHKFGTDGNVDCKLLRMIELGWWPGTESNRRRQPFQGCALPAELPGRGSFSLSALLCPPQSASSSSAPLLSAPFAACRFPVRLSGWPKCPPANPARLLPPLRVVSQRLPPSAPGRQRMRSECAVPFARCCGPWIIPGGS